MYNGNLYIKFEVEFPAKKSLTDEQKLALSKVTFKLKDFTKLKQKTSS